MGSKRTSVKTGGKTLETYRHLPKVCLLLFHMAASYVTTHSNALAFGESEKMN